MFYSKKNIYNIVNGWHTKSIQMAVAQPATPIKFAKGSYCGSWSGSFRGDTKTFSLGLGVNQEVSVEVADGSVLSSVRGPSGQLNTRSDGSVDYFATKRAGQHYVAVVYIPSKYADNPNAGAYATVEVCAY